MPQLRSSRTPRPLLSLVVLAAIALGACSERPTPTQPTPQSPNRVIICDEGCGGGGGGGGEPPPPPPPAITSLSLPNTTLPIDGVSVTYTATLANAGPTLSGVVAQGYIVQGSARRAAGGTQVNCGAGMGVLPSGTCQISFIAVAGNSLSGGGTLVQGPAIFELDLTAGSSTTSRTAGVTLIPGTFNVQTNPGALGTLSLSGAPGLVYASIHGGSQTVSGLSYQMTVIQGQVHRSAGSALPACPRPGDLPPSAWCLTTLSPSVTNGVGGSGTLSPGPATFQVSLLQGTTVLSTKSWPLTLVDARFLSFTASPNPMRIGGGSQPFTAAISNASAAMGNVSVIAQIRQPAGVSSPVWAQISCGSGPGNLPAGSCAITGAYAADTGSFWHNLVPGPATLTLELSGQDASAFLIAVTSVPVTLVSLPSLGTVTLTGSPNIAIPGTVAGFTVPINNPGPAISNATVMVRIFQNNNAVRQAVSGPVSVNCGSGAGTLPAGTCTFNGLYSASNTAPGTGTLVPGPATLEIELSDPANGDVSYKYVPITILGS